MVVHKLQFSSLFWGILYLYDASGFYLDFFFMLSIFVNKLAWDISASKHLIDLLYYPLRSLHDSEPAESVLSPLLFSSFSYKC